MVSLTVLGESVNHLMNPDMITNAFVELLIASPTRNGSVKFMKTFLVESQAVNFDDCQKKEVMDVNLKCESQSV